MEAREEAEKEMLAWEHKATLTLTLTLMEGDRSFRSRQGENRGRRGRGKGKRLEGFGGVGGGEKLGRGGSQEKV